MTPGRGAAAAFTALLVPLTLISACGRPSTDLRPSTAPSGSASAATPGTTSQSPAEDSSFTFDDIASYDSGLEVEIAGSQARPVAAGMSGAETTQGQMVVVSILIRNNSDTDVDATPTLVTATYGAGDTEAGLVIDPTGQLANGFLGSITPGAEDTVEYGFAIPFSALSRVTVTVDLADGVHEPVSFTGSVAREQ